MALVPRPATNRLTEADPDYQRLHARTQKRLRASVRLLMRDLRAGQMSVPEAQRAFIQRHTALLREAYTTAHQAGAHDYFQGVSHTPTRWAATVTPNAKTQHQRLLYYAAHSVMKLASEAARAHHQSLVQRRHRQLAEWLDEAVRLSWFHRGGHETGYTQNRNHGKFAPGNGRQDHEATGEGRGGKGEEETGGTHGHGAITGTGKKGHQETDAGNIRIARTASGVPSHHTAQEQADQAAATKGEQEALGIGGAAAAHPAGVHGVAARLTGELGRGVTIEASDPYLDTSGHAFLAHVFGRPLADHEIAALVGARPGDRVRFTTMDRPPKAARDDFSRAALGIQVLGANHAYVADRTLELIQGNVTMWNASIRVSSEHQGQGYGTELFAREVTALKTLGVDQIKTAAAGSASDKSYNGYYTWARLGYNAPFSTKAGEPPLPGVPHLPAWASHARDMHELMALPASHGHESGAAWWKANGNEWSGTFDLHPGSRSVDVLRAYLKEKGQHIPGVQLAEVPPTPATPIPAPTGKPRAVEEIDWTPDDEAAADRAWAKLARLWAAEDAGHVQAAEDDGDTLRFTYNPNQPRNPAGSPGAGRWAAEDIAKAEHAHHEAVREERSARFERDRADDAIIPTDLAHKRASAAFHDTVARTTDAVLRQHNAQANSDLQQAVQAFDRADQAVRQALQQRDAAIAGLAKLEDHVWGDPNLSHAERTAREQALGASREYHQAQAAYLESNRAVERAERVWEDANNHREAVYQQHLREIDAAVQQHPDVVAARTAMEQAQATAEAAHATFNQAYAAHKVAEERAALTGMTVDQAHGGVGVVVHGADTFDVQAVARDALGPEAATPQGLARLLGQITAASHGDVITLAVELPRYGSGGARALKIEREHYNTEADRQAVAAARARREHIPEHGDFTIEVERVTGPAARALGLPDGARVAFVPGAYSKDDKGFDSGARMLRAVEAMQGMGLARIYAHAASGGSYTGYDTWAKLGGEGKLPQGFTNYLKMVRDMAAQGGSEDTIARSLGFVKRDEQTGHEHPDLAYTHRVIEIAQAHPTRVEQIQDYGAVGKRLWHDKGSEFDVVLNLLPGGRTAEKIATLQARRARSNAPTTLAEDGAEWEAWLDAMLADEEGDDTIRLGRPGQIGGQPQGYQQARNHGKFAPGEGRQDHEAAGRAKAAAKGEQEAMGVGKGAATKGPREPVAPRANEPTLDAPTSARRAALDQRFGHYSDMARVAAVDHLLGQHPELVRALQAHYGGHLEQPPLTEASLAARLNSGAKPSAAQRQAARATLEHLQALSEWSLLHGAGDTAISAHGTMTLYHGMHTSDPKGVMKELQRTDYRAGKSFTSDQHYARRLASAYRQSGEQVVVARAEVPVSAIMAHDTLFKGSQRYPRTAYENEYVLGTGTKLQQVTALSEAPTDDAIRLEGFDSHKHYHGKGGRYETGHAQEKESAGDGRGGGHETTEAGNSRITRGPSGARARRLGIGGLGRKPGAQDHDAAKAQAKGESEALGLKGATKGPHAEGEAAPHGEAARAATTTHDLAGLRAEAARLEAHATEREQVAAAAEAHYKEANAARIAARTQLDKYGTEFSAHWEDRPEDMSFEAFTNAWRQAADAHKAANAASDAAWTAQGKARAEADEARYQANRATALAERAAHPVQSPYHPDLAALEKLNGTDRVNGWLNQTFPGTTFNLSGAHADAAKQVAREIADLAQAHPEAMATLKYVGYDESPAMRSYRAEHGLTDEHMTGAKEGWAGSYDNEGHSILLSRLALGNPKKAQEEFNMLVEKHWQGAAPGTNVTRYVLRHEFGHHIYTYLTEHTDAGHRAAANRQYLVIGSRYNAGTISDYARTMRDEHFAEGFAAARYGRPAAQADGYVQEMRDMVDAFA